MQPGLPTVTLWRRWLEPPPDEAHRPERRRVGLIDFRNTGVWVAVLLILLVVLNAAAFLVYRASHSAKGLSLQLWNYAESDTAKLIAASLIFPLAIFLVEGRFNVVENVRARPERGARCLEG